MGERPEAGRCDQIRTVQNLFNIESMFCGKKVENPSAKLHAFRIRFAAVKLKGRGKGEVPRGVSGLAYINKISPPILDLRSVAG